MEWKKDCLVVYLEIDFDLFASQNFKSIISESIKNQKPKKLIFNLQEVSYMDSSGIGALVWFMQTHKEEIKIRICNVQESVLSILKLTGLDRLFPIDKTEEESLANMEITI